MHSTTLALPGPAQKPYKDGAGGPILVGVLTALALVGGVVTWSATMSVASAAITSGKVSVEGNRKAVQHRDGGQVGTVFVQEGQRVEKGQKLIQLELAEAKAEAEVLTSGRVIGLIRAARLRAERAGAVEFAFPKELADLKDDPQASMVYQQESALLGARRAAHLGQVSLLRQQIEGSRRQIGGFQERRKSLKTQLDSVNDELASLKPLQEKGLIARPRVLTLERSGASLQGDIESINGMVAAEEDKIRAAEIQISQLTKDREELIAKETAENDTKLAEIEPRLVSARQRLEQGVIVAPESGFVYGLAVFGRGSALAPGQTAMEIVPADDQMVVSVDIEPTDINRVHPGQPADIHFLPYRSRYQAAIHGTLEKVSADRFEDKATGKSFYRGVVKVEKKDLEAAKVEMTPGMPAQVTIETGKRTILAYFLDPILQIYDFALKEQ